jgi:hypothetical protein
MSTSPSPATDAPLITEVASPVALALLREISRLEDQRTMRRVSLVTIATLFALCAGLASAFERSVSTADSPARWPRDVPAAATPAPEEDGTRRDLYGNPVQDAVATYRLDPTGSLYEIHSPQIELPRLKPPTT